MKKSKKLFVLLAVVAILTVSVFSFAACTPNDSVLTVYTNAGFAPFEFMHGNEVVGVDVEIGKAIAKKLGKKVEVKSIDFDAITEAVKNKPNSSVGIAGMTIKEIDGIVFSNAYFTSQQYILAKKGTIAAVDGEAGIAALNNKKIGVQLSTTGHDLITKSIDNGSLTASAPTTNKDLNVLYTMLDAGSIDALVLDKLPVESFLSKNPDGLEVIKISGVEVESYGVAVAEGQDALLKVVNEVLEENKAQILTWVTSYNDLYNSLS